MKEKLQNITNIRVFRKELDLHCIHNSISEKVTKFSICILENTSGPYAK